MTECKKSEINCPQSPKKLSPNSYAVKFIFNEKTKEIDIQIDYPDNDNINYNANMLCELILNIIKPSILENLIEKLNSTAYKAKDIDYKKCLSKLILNIQENCDNYNINPVISPMDVFITSTGRNNKDEVN